MKNIFSLVCIGFFISFNVLSAQSYDLVETKHGIDKFERTDEANDHHWTKLETIIEATVTEITDFTREISNLTSWVYACEESKKLEEDGDNVVYYTITDMPYPMSDRLTVIKKKVKTDTLTGVFSSISENYDEYDMDSDLVRVPRFKTIWIFEPLPDNKTKISYEITVDPGGSIPEWLKARFSDHGPIKSLENLKKRFE